jgi:ABC-type oligopeptide transport system ATPase subunit
MDRGKIVEQGTPNEIFLNPAHDRTKSFISKVTDGLEWQRQVSPPPITSHSDPVERESAGSHGTT